MGTMRPSARAVDLRAHYSASSTRGDDDRFRAQAVSCLTFERVSVLKLDEERAEQKQQHLSVIQASQTVAAPALTDVTTETQAAVLALDSQLPRLGSPVAEDQGFHRSGRTNTVALDKSCSSQSRGHTTRSPCTNSSHLRTPIFHRTANRRRINREQNVYTRSALAEICGITDHQSTSQPEGNGHSSELPTSYSLSDLASGSARSILHSIQRTSSDLGPVSSKAQPPASSTDIREAVGNDILPNADASTEPESIHHPALPDLSVTSPVTSARSTGRAMNAATKLIQPPPACIGIGAFTSHVTDRLQYLADSPKLEHVYNPVKTRRSVQPLERGHWSFSIASWSHTSQLSFWSFLNDFIVSGAGGWGIMCTWSPIAHDGSKDLVKAFCWGELIKHTYLLLYVASRSRIQKLSLHWMDGTGKVVAQTKGKTQLVTPTRKK